MTVASSSINPAYRVRQRVVIHWFRLADLRLHDNPALTHSSLLAKGNENKRRCKVIPIFCFDNRIFGGNNLTQSGSLKCGPRRAKFILESVIDLRKRLQQQLKSQLLVGFGEPAEVFRKLLTILREGKELDGYTDFELNADIVCQDEPATEERNVVREVSAVLTEFNPEKVLKRVQRIWGSTLYMPRKMPFAKNFKDISCRAQGFTNRMVQMHKAEEVMPVPKYLPFLSHLETDMISFMPTLQDLGYTDEQITIANLIDPRSKAAMFIGGETAGLARIQEYIWDTNMLKDFGKMRNVPIIQNQSSRFSAWLAHGCLSSRFIAAEAIRYVKEKYEGRANVIAYHDLVYRDFCKYYAVPHSTRLFHPDGPVPQKHGEYQYKTRSRRKSHFEAWKNGATGYPLVDASMRELSATGFITDRCRMIVASFLCNDLFHDWTRGADWFESNLTDYNVFCNWVVSTAFFFGPLVLVFKNI
jgi:deoxyribodipyrimidine photo-lyase